MFEALNGHHLKSSTFLLIKIDKYQLLDNIQFLIGVKYNDRRIV